MKYLSTLLLSTVTSISVQATEWEAIKTIDPITDEVTKYAFITSKGCSENCPTLTFGTFKPTKSGLPQQRDCFDLDFKEDVLIKQIFNSYTTNIIYRIDKGEPIDIGSTELVNPTTARICYPTTDDLKLTDFRIGIFNGENRVVFRSTSSKGSPITIIFDLKGHKEAINDTQPGFKETQIERKNRILAFLLEADKKALKLKEERSNKLKKNGT